VSAARHRSLERAQLVFDRGEVGGAGEGVVTQRTGASGRRALIVERDAGALLPGQLAPCERELPGEGPEERGLAGAVRTGEGEPVTPLHLERDAVEEGRASDLLAQVGRDHDCHGVL
jgi:hypothetical protein